MPIGRSQRMTLTLRRKTAFFCKASGFEPTHQWTLPPGESPKWPEDERTNVNSELPKKPAACVSALSLSCKEAARLQSHAMARPLSFLERLGLGLHLLICSWCRRFGSQVRLLHSTMNECPEREHAEPSRSLSAEARERIERRLRVSQQPQLAECKVHVVAPDHFAEGRFSARKTSPD